ncbi:MAG: glycine cleavage T C-terminal barrel domain-containing protein, partial [Pseudomonadota bacterium]
FCTSGGYAHHTGKSIALGFLPRDAGTEGRAVEIEILGQMRHAKVMTSPLFDPDGGRMRG